MIKDLEGLKFPDEFVVRFFFKEGLNKKKGKVLELGCSNGNNLSMFYQYGWDVTGVDINQGLIKKAKNNFAKCKSLYGLKNAYNFYAKDMVDFAAAQKDSCFDALLLASSIDYLDYPEIVKLLAYIKENRFIKNNSMIFVRLRTPQDYRYGRGERRGEKTFKLNIKETGEHGSLITFLTESELMSILETNFDFQYKRIFHCNFDNLQNGYMISNSNIIFWGQIIL
jgi:SAM-dependent methyltransferase